MALQRAAWKGQLKLALVSCPIRLFKATGQGEKLSGHYRHRDTKNRIHMIPHDPVLGKVAHSDLVIAYEHRDQYVVLSDLDLAEIRTPSDKTLLIESFVPTNDVDPIYLDQPYFLVPDGNIAIDTVNVLRSSMVNRGKTALGRLVLNRRERLVAIAVRGQGFLVTSLRNADEVKDADAFFNDLPSGDPSIEVQNLAEQLVAMRSGRFDPHMFKDRYQAALKDLIEQKVTYGETIDTAVKPSLMEAANDDEIQPPTTVADAFRQSIDRQRKPPANSRTKTGSNKTTRQQPPRLSEETPG